jgi:integrase
MYAGLRRGELMALRADRIDTAAGVIHVDKGWDMIEAEVDTKGRNRRRVPIAQALREPLLAHMIRTGRRGDDLVFGRIDRLSFDYRRLSDRADAAWKPAGLDRITPHARVADDRGGRQRQGAVDLPALRP